MTLRKDKQTVTSQAQRRALRTQEHLPVIPGWRRKRGVGMDATGAKRGGIPGRLEGGALSKGGWCRGQGQHWVGCRSRAGPQLPEGRCRSLELHTCLVAQDCEQLMGTSLTESGYIVGRCRTVNTDKRESCKEAMVFPPLKAHLVCSPGEGTVRPLEAVRLNLHRWPVSTPLFLDPGAETQIGCEQTSRQVSCPETWEGGAPGTNNVMKKKEMRLIVTV